MNAEAFNPRTAIDQFFKKKLTGTQLMRCMACYRGWQVPARLEGLVPVFTDFDLGAGSVHFFIFTDKDAYLECRNKLGIDVVGEYFIGNVAGFNAFDAIADAVTVLNVNPYSFQEIHYTKEQLPRLKSWAKIVKTERALDAASSARTGYEAIKSFDSYYFIMEDEQYISLAPDGRGRKLAALFTADDALDLFIERNGKPTMRAVPIGGEALFSAIRRMPLDGMVFNCSGPITPRAFPLTFADDVLAFNR